MSGFNFAAPGSDIGAGLLSFGLNQISASKQFKRQKQLMDKQNRINQQNWHMQNSYNTPKAQMERLAAAGLNPDLIYGGGAGALQSGDISPVSQGSASMAAPANLGTPGSSGAALALQADSVKSQIDLNKALSKKALSEAGKTETETKGLIIDNENKQKSYDFLFKEAQSRIKLNDNQSSYFANSCIEIQQKVRNLSVEEVGMKIDNLFKEPRYKAEISDFLSRAHLSREQAIDLSVTRFSRLKVLNEEAANYSASAYHHTTSGALADEQATGQNLQNQLTTIYGPKEHQYDLVYKDMAAQALILSALNGNVNSMTNFMQLFKSK